MTHFKTIAAAAALMLAAGPALAVTVTNQSDKAMTVTVDLGATEPKTEIEAGKSAKLECPEGCELRVPTFSYGLAAKTGDEVVIGKEGYLGHKGATAAKEARNSESGRAAKTKAN